MTSSWQFSEVCGNNVRLSEGNSVALWTLKVPGGFAFCESELQTGETIDVLVEGSGRCDIGFTKMNSANDPQSSFKALNEVRAHRRKCRIPIRYDQGREQVSSSFNDKTYRKKVDKDETIRAAVNIMYGQMSAVLLKNGSADDRCKFSTENAGANIDLKDDNTIAHSIRGNPASVCFMSQQLRLGQSIDLRCSPVNDGDRVPGKFGVKLMISDTDPKRMRNQYLFLFDATEPQHSTLPMKEIEYLEKEDCTGTITITLSQKGTMQYITGRGKINEQIISIQSEGVWIAFDLYRVVLHAGEIKLTANANKGSDDAHSVSIADVSLTYKPEDQLGATNVCDSKPLEPSVQLNPDTDMRAMGATNLCAMKSLEPAPVQYFGPTATLGCSGAIEGRLRIVEDNVKYLMANHAACSERQPNTVVVSASCPEVEDEIDNNSGDTLDCQPFFPQLVRDLHTQEFLDHLYANKIITMEQMHSIRTKATTEQANANRELLKIMTQNKAKLSKSLLKEILNLCGQTFLLSWFYPSKDSNKETQ